jgi:hypothetical protein
MARMTPAAVLAPEQLRQFSVSGHAFGHVVEGSPRMTRSELTVIC